MKKDELTGYCGFYGRYMKCVRNLVGLTCWRLPICKATREIELNPWSVGSGLWESSLELCPVTDFCVSCVGSSSVTAVSSCGGANETHRCVMLAAHSVCHSNGRIIFVVICCVW
jgi:hypothetical protein